VNKYTIKDLKKALDHMENKVQASAITLEQDDHGRLKLGAHDISSNHVLITVYKSNEEGSLKFPDITKTERL
jgi:hypothetical protein